MTVGRTRQSVEIAYANSFRIGMRTDIFHLRRALAESADHGFLRWPAIPGLRQLCPSPPSYLLLLRHVVLLRGRLTLDLLGQLVHCGLEFGHLRVNVGPSLRSDGHLTRRLQVVMHLLLDLLVLRLQVV